jgi:hypothetical protein
VELGCGISFRLPHDQVIPRYAFADSAQKYRTEPALRLGGGPEASSASFAFGQLENEKQLLVPYKSVSITPFLHSRRPPDPIPPISLSGCISAER